MQLVSEAKILIRNNYLVLSPNIVLKLNIPSADVGVQFKFQIPQSIFVLNSAKVMFH